VGEVGGAERAGGDVLPRTDERCAVDRVALDGRALEVEVGLVMSVRGEDDDEGEGDGDGGEDAAASRAGWRCSWR